MDLEICRNVQSVAMLSPQSLKDISGKRKFNRCRLNCTRIPHIQFSTTHKYDTIPLTMLTLLVIYC